MLFTFSGTTQWAHPQLCLVVTGTCMESLDLLIMEQWVVWAQGMEPVFFQPTDIHSWLGPIVKTVWPSEAAILLCQTRFQFRSFLSSLQRPLI